MHDFWTQDVACGHSFDAANGLVQVGSHLVGQLKIECGGQSSSSKTVPFVDDCPFIWT